MIFTLKIIRGLNRLHKQGKITSSKMVELMNEAVYCEMDNEFTKGKVSGHDYLVREIKEIDGSNSEDRPLL